MILGSIEAGGTKFVCAVGDENYKIIDKIIIPTTTPEETLKKCIDFFKQKEGLCSLSISTFGPIEDKVESEQYGYILNTPKKGWKHIDFLKPFKEALNIPIIINTDVNGSAYGEYITMLKNNKNINSLVYLTIGTGIGGGVVVNGEIQKNYRHPEMGHLIVKRHSVDKYFNGICPFHKNCLEGLASGPSIEARLKVKGENVESDHYIWDVLAYYIAQSIYQVTMVLRPECVIIGGGVVNLQLLNKVKEEYENLCNNYIDFPNINNYINMPNNNENTSATIGNFALAHETLQHL